jgi:CMP-N-acetylneuraminic acid synthetase|tara:strand:- start:2032 stop:2721 length:690 start_codon:yes stop_codon:yes gene_type:complete
MPFSIAIIPARQGSKRVPGKNKSLFGNKTLVAHAIEQAIDSNVFDRIIVTSDDNQIIDIARSYNTVVLERNKLLSSDNATLLDVIRDVIEHESIPVECCIGLLLVTAPLRTVEDIREAYDLYINAESKKSVVSVCSNINPIDLSWKVSDNCLKPVFPESYNQNISKHFREKTYFFNDACVYDSAERFLKKDRNLFGNMPIPYIMPQERSLFIDYKFQLDLIQSISKKPQ